MTSGGPPAGPAPLPPAPAPPPAPAEAPPRAATDEPPPPHAPHAPSTPHVQLAARVGRSLQTLNKALRRSGGAPGEAVGFAVGSAAHNELVAALADLEAVRLAMLAMDG